MPFLHTSRCSVPTTNIYSKFIRTPILTPLPCHLCVALQTCRELQSVLMGDNQMDHVPPSLQDLPMLRALDLR